MEKYELTSYVDSGKKWYSRKIRNINLPVSGYFYAYDTSICTLTQSADRNTVLIFLK
jgi:hypothetical protein